MYPLHIPGLVAFIWSSSASTSYFMKQNNSIDFFILTPETNTNSSALSRHITTLPPFAPSTILIPPVSLSQT
uniref:Uncharacterized protein n=1 Tax=Kalanchoe fedtschenkoi TaxID=63787 RepID=A0A7N0UZ98_KALFE